MPKENRLVVSTRDKAQAEKQLKMMKRSLQAWLKVRNKLDAAASGQVKANVPASVVADMLPRVRDWQQEAKLAAYLHNLLSQVFDAQKLPKPDISKDPNAAVKLAEIAISGTLPSEAPSQSPQGIVWLWPAVVLAGLVMVTMITKIRTEADVAKHKEEIECRKLGLCSDTEYYLKLGGLAVAGWFLWTKAGLGQRVKKMLSGR